MSRWMGIAVKVLATVALFHGAQALALEKKDVVGQWAIDMDKSKAASDGNTAGLMADLKVKEDGTFEALYGSKGTWKIQGGKLLVDYDNDFKKGREGSMADGFLKFPAPAMHDKFCYMKRSGAAPAEAATATAPSAGKLAVGSKVKCNWKSLGKFYGGTVAKMDGNSVDINYDDGDKETTTADKCTAQ